MAGTMYRYMNVGILLLHRAVNTFYGRIGSLDPRATGRWDEYLRAIRSNQADDRQSHQERFQRNVGPG
jgi:hypothetical protein